MFKPPRKAVFRRTMKVSKYGFGLFPWILQAVMPLYGFMSSPLPFLFLAYIAPVPYSYGKFR